VVAVLLLACSPANIAGGGSEAPVASVAISLPNAALGVGQTTQATAVTKDANGSTLSGRNLTWQSRNAAVATVSVSGLITAVTVGTSRIVVTSEGQGDSAMITVSPAPPAPVATVSVALDAASIQVGQGAQATATLKDANGATLTGRSITWSSSSPSVASVSSTGAVSGLAAGTTQITATSEGKTGSASLTVIAGPPAPVASVTVALGASSIQVGQGTQATATLKDANGNTLTGRTITWSSSAPSVASVSSSGAVTALAAGSTQITATSEGQSGSATVTVTVVPVATVVVALAASSVTVGQSTQATATLKDANGNTLTGRTVTWSSNNTAVATVSSAGLVNALAAGSAQITATSEGKTGSASLTVTAASPPPVATVTVALASSSLSVGQGTQATATLKDANGNTLTGRTITWSSSVASVASVSSTGAVTALAAGSSQITATSEGKSGFASLTVTATSGGPVVNECATPQPGWIFCDDFEQDRTSKYFEYDNSSGGFVRSTGNGVGGSTSMRATWTQAGQVSAGHLSLAFGRTPDPYFKPVDAGTANYREIYWRFYVRPQVGWQGGSNWKLTRLMIFANSNWAEAMTAYVSGHFTDPQLDLDAVSGTDAAGNLTTTKYNDFNNERELGLVKGITPIFGSTGGGQWYCVEAHTRLNDPGQSNGVHEFWVNGSLEASETGLNWVGSYSAYGINAMNVLENYSNNGVPQPQYRDFDNVVVSTQRVGCP
jgi:uncharacterized protein YjdB